MIDVNIKGIFYAIAAIVLFMRERKSGHVINLSSVAGHNIYPGGTVYCGTKFAVRAISEGLRQEEAMNGTNIRVTNISPGSVSSELLETTTDPTMKAGLEEFYKIAIDAENIARAISFVIEQPSDVAINEMIIRPKKQEG
ncbi:SDR family oxidoreductase [Peribacillus sp. FSL E2-0218]|uniref:SDR family oxidoreductase n=1 Tax=Peribacillus sp. FSL E2-0218 TaxID=2921364 RepID=UPI0030EEF580